MARNNFWNDASRCGAIVGLVNVVFSVVGMLLPSLSFLFSLAALVITIWLLYRYAHRRALSYGDAGFSYSQSLGFIVCMGIFAGIICGAYEIISSNFLFTAKYEEAMDTMVAAYSQAGVFDNATIDKMMKLYRSFVFSPVPALFSQTLGTTLLYGFYGLFISIGAKRDPDMFDSSDEE